MYVRVSVCLCVCVSACFLHCLVLAGGKEGESFQGGQVQSQHKQEIRGVCVSVHAHAHVCLCRCYLGVATWLTPQLKPVPRPHTLSPGAQSSRSSSAPARQAPVAEAPPLLDLEATDTPQAAPLSQMPLTTSAPSSKLSLLDDPTPPTAVVSGEVCLSRPLAACACDNEMLAET